jgi:hypothetical protein
MGTNQDSVGLLLVSVGLQQGLQLHQLVINTDQDSVSITERLHFIHIRDCTHAYTSDWWTLGGTSPMSVDCGLHAPMSCASCMNAADMRPAFAVARVGISVRGASMIHGGHAQALIMNGAHSRPSTPSLSP